ncbi:PTS fructose transporter subunit IIC [Tetragenococcus halophilus subsp. flandriensis]|uniref:PTS fructose transporter subunit IIC n=1 Tax=Tetragenococcus halophilus TaxID=51669 RepID=UPI0023EA205C|nr:PTS fructose transporter subunit IIC [Tetragenococcus halophilus]GMA08733.1 PTS fructose transporter subunit IIC [Tetragenococcus halophilus subsp. flandriensis]
MANKKLQDLQQHLMTGISYMIPIIVPAGIIMGIGIMIGQLSGFDAQDAALLEGTDSLQQFVAWVTQIAGAGMMGLMFPVFAAYVSYSISDKPGLAPGFIGGYLANEMGSGFLGAVAIGLFSGYLVQFLNDKIKFNRTFRPVKTMFIVPVLSAILVVVASYFVVGPIGLLLVDLITRFINFVGGGGEMALAAVIAGSMAFDLGGPVNKTALALSMQLNTDTGANAWVPAMIGAVIPAIGIGLATLIDQLVLKKSVYDNQMKTNGMACFILGFMGISEGAMPFAIKDPLFMIPLNVIASAIGGAIAALLGTSAVTGVPAAIWGWPLSTNPLGWVIAVVVGSFIVCVGALYRGSRLMAKVTNENDV